MDFPLSIVDVVTYIPIIFLVIALFHLSNKEIKKSLEQSKRTAEILNIDRTELIKRLEKSNQELRDERLARLNELSQAAEFGRLSQGLFHDLITPLTSVILHTEKLKDPTATKHSIEKAVEASHRMAAYIKDMRATLSREESERVCILKEELESVLHLFTYAAREKGIEISILHADECTWYGSPLKLRQLFSNLISNAMDAFNGMERVGPKKIEISLLQKNTGYEIRISDTGCGISEKNLETIFDPFFTTKPQDKGTGIGLTTVKSIVEKNLKGKIEVESAEHQGTTFTITFPARDRDPAASPRLQ